MTELNASSIMARLLAIPAEVFDAESATSAGEAIEEYDIRHLKELKESLEIAELNAALNAPSVGSNEKARDLARKAWINCDETVLADRAAIKLEEANLAEHAAETRGHKACRAAVRAELDALREIAGLMREKVALEHAKLDLETAKAQVEILEALEKKGQ